jgi:hypothetical protein
MTAVTLEDARRVIGAAEKKAKEMGQPQRWLRRSGSCGRRGWRSRVLTRPAQ